MAYDFTCPHNLQTWKSKKKKKKAKIHLIFFLLSSIFIEISLFDYLIIYQQNKYFFDFRLLSSHLCFRPFVYSFLHFLFVSFFIFLSKCYSFHFISSTAASLAFIKSTNKCFKKKKQHQHNSLARWQRKFQQ